MWRTWHDATTVMFELGVRLFVELPSGRAGPISQPLRFPKHEASRAQGAGSTSSTNWCGTHMKIEKLTREAFAPFGEVITLAGAQHYPINDGTTERFHDLAFIDVSDQGGKPLISLFRSKPRPLPFEINIMERHPLGSQAFIPLSRLPYLVIVAAPGPFDERTVRAFLAERGEGVNYAKGTWHHGLVALYEASDFIVIDRGGPGVSCEESSLSRPILFTELELRGSSDTGT
jgi:ureidoglycolate lyase